ncbi:MAG: hypothetical protein CMP98_11655 [Gammaproteobacteria bacterium]|nr:hypothetical protein [Gammaproteobacteria bacterium]
MQRVGVGSGILNFVYQHDEGDYYSVEANMSFDVSNKIGLLFQADSEGSGVKVGGCLSDYNIGLGYTFDDRLSNVILFNDIHKNDNAVSPRLTAAF